MDAKNIAVSIRKSRLQAGLTQKDVASAVGKGQTTIASWETGRSQPDAATIIFLAALFDVSSDYLLGISDVTKPPDRDTTGDRIKARRQQLGMSTEALARQLNMPTYVVQRYEAGELDTSWETIMEDIPPLASALQCSPEYLMGWERFDNGQQSIDLLLIPIDIADRTGFDRLAVNEALDDMMETEGISIYRKMFDRDAHKSLMARTRDIQTAKNLSNIRKSLEALNIDGQKEAVKRIAELAKISQYQSTDKNE